LSAGIFAASLPPLKSTFEKFLSKVVGITSGLTTPGATKTFKSGAGYGGGHGGGYGGGTLHQSRRSHHLSSNHDIEHGKAEYVDMDEMGRRRGRKEFEDIEEEDQKHILRNGAASVKTGSEDENGDWIMKTVEFTVNDSASVRQDSNTPGIAR
jgi:hypothetical protein